MTMMKRLCFLGVVIALSLQALQAQLAEDALRFSQYGLNVGARSVGMGSLSVGLADDYSALFSNPAGLAQIRSYEFSAGVSRLGYSNDATFAGSIMSANNSATNLSNLGLVYPIATTRGSLTFAFGFGRTANYATTASFGGFNIQNSYIEVFTPHDTLVDNLRLMTPQNRKTYLDNNIAYSLGLADTANGYVRPLLTDSLQQAATVLEGGGMNHWSFGGAFDIAPGLSMGISLNFASGSYSYSRQYVETDPKNVYTNFDRFVYTQNVQSDLTGFNMLFGMMYRKQGKFRLGLTLRTPTTYEISRTTGETYQSILNGSSHSINFSDTQPTSYKVVTPMVLSTGLSFTPFEWFTFGGDAEYTDWTELKFDSNNQDLISENLLIKTSLLRPTTNLRGGAEISLFNLGLKLRSGVVWNPSPFKQDENTHDYDQIYYTGGIGITLEQNTSIDISYAYGFWKWSRATDDLFSVANALQTNESIKTYTINVTISYRF